jgi:hypothetical protein
MSHIEGDGFSPHRCVLIRAAITTTEQRQERRRASASRSDEWNVAWRRSEHCIDDHKGKRNTDQGKDKAVFGTPTMAFSFRSTWRSIFWSSDIVTSRNSDGCYARAY